MFDIFAPQTITNGKMAIIGELWRLQERSEQLGSFSALNLILSIFKENPNLDRLKLEGDMMQSYDDNNYYSEVELDRLCLQDANEQIITTFTLDGGKYTTEDKYDGDGEEEAFGWLNSDGVIWDCKDYFEYIIQKQGGLRLDINRATIESLLGESYNFELGMYLVFGWVNRFMTEAQDRALAKAIDND